MEGKAGCCQNCKAPCAGDFKKVVDLQYSGLVIYLHTKRDEQKKTACSKVDDTYILHNTGTKQLQGPEYISELNQFKTKCGQCKIIVQRVRSLLDEIKAINENEVIGICEHCKRVSLHKTCQRCNFIVNKFISTHQKRCEEKQQRFKVWLCRVRHLLQAILDGESVCQHRVYKNMELERILHELKVPLSMREPDIDFFPSLGPGQLTSLQSLSVSKEMLETLLAKLKSEKRFSSDDSLYPSPSKEICICKSLKERYFKAGTSGLDTERPILIKDTEVVGELPTDLSKLLSDEVYKKLINRLLDLSKALPQGLYLNRKLVLELIDTLDTAINQGLTTDIIDKLIKDLSELSKSLTHDLSRDLSREVIHGLITDLNDLLTLGSSKTLSNNLKKLLVDLTELLTQELSKESTQSMPEIVSKNIGKDIAPISTKNLRKEPTQDVSLGQSITTSRSSPKSQTKEITKDLSKGLQKDVTQGLSKDKHKKVTPELPKSRGKEISQALSKHKEARPVSPKNQDKIISKALSKGKDVLPVKPKDVKKGSTSTSLKDQSKRNKEIKRESPADKTKEKIQTPSKEVNKQLVQKLGNLNKALTQRKPNKELVQEISKEINKTLTQTSPDLNKKIIKEMTDLTKPATQGIPPNANKKQIKTLLEDTSKALIQGLSKNENKKEVQGLLNDLNKAMTKGTKDDKQQLSKDLTKGVSRDASKGLSSGLSNKASAPVSKDMSTKPTGKSTSAKQETKTGKEAFKDKKRSKSKRHDDQATESDEDVHKKEKESRKSTSKKKSSVDKSSKEKENISPADKKSVKKGKLKESSENVRITKKPPDSILLRMLKGKEDAEDRYKLHQERQLAKQREMEKKKLRALAMKNKLAVKKKKKSLEPLEEISESTIVECNLNRSRLPKRMVRGNTIVPYDSHYKDEGEASVETQIFKTKIEFTEPRIFGSSPDITNMAALRKSEQLSDDYMSFQDGVIRYRLSDREFIDKGWTKLPTKKIMRRMNIYKMKPANPQYDWFERHKKEKELFYDSGDRLADIDENSRGHWYYRNGATALDYHNAKELNTGQRYVVYSSGEEMENGKQKPRTVLALFDVLGNGIVYDHYGKVRLKYNQSEGLLVDPKLGPPGKWKWHTLNDPPVLQQVFVNTCLKERDPELESVLSNDKDAVVHVRKPSNTEMLAIELDNFVKEKATKVLQKFKPFQIRMKAIKLNKQFSLKIMDQANIYLLFREGVTSLKLNLGMLLISNEIIDTDTSDMEDVATPYDKHPAMSDSVENIQKILKAVRSGKVRSPSE